MNDWLLTCINSQKIKKKLKNNKLYLKANDENYEHRHTKQSLPQVQLNMQHILKKKIQKW